MRISTPERYQRQSLKKSEGDFHRLYQSVSQNFMIPIKQGNEKWIEKYLFPEGRPPAILFKHSQAIRVAHNESGEFADMRILFQTLGSMPGFNRVLFKIEKILDNAYKFSVLNAICGQTLVKVDSICSDVIHDMSTQLRELHSKQVLKIPEKVYMTFNQEDGVLVGIQNARKEINGIERERAYHNPYTPLEVKKQLCMLKYLPVVKVGSISKKFDFRLVHIGRSKFLTFKVFPSVHIITKPIMGAELLGNLLPQNFKEPTSMKFVAGWLQFRVPLFQNYAEVDRATPLHQLMQYSFQIDTPQEWLAMFPGSVCLRIETLVKDEDHFVDGILLDNQPRDPVQEPANQAVNQQVNMNVNQQPLNPPMNVNNQQPINDVSNVNNVNQAQQPVQDPSQQVKRAWRQPQISQDCIIEEGPIVVISLDKFSCIFSLEDLFFIHGENFFCPSCLKSHQSQNVQIHTFCGHIMCNECVAAYSIQRIGIDKCFYCNAKPSKLMKATDINRHAFTGNKDPCGANNSKFFMNFLPNGLFAQMNSKNIMTCHYIQLVCQVSWETCPTVISNFVIAQLRSSNGWVGVHPYWKNKLKEYEVSQEDSLLSIALGNAKFNKEELDRFDAESTKSVPNNRRNGFCDEEEKGNFFFRQASEKSDWVDEDQPMFDNFQKKKADIYQADLDQSVLIQEEVYGANLKEWQNRRADIRSEPPEENDLNLSLEARVRELKNCGGRRTVEKPYSHGESMRYQE